MTEPIVGRIERRWILGAMMLTMLLAAVDSTIIATAVPQIVTDLGGFAWIGWVFSIYLLLQMVCIPIYGKLADLHGRKPILVFGTCVFLLGSGCCALAWNMPSLVAFRGLQGLGAGAIMATVATLAGDLSLCASALPSRAGCPACGAWRRSWDLPSAVRWSSTFPGAGSS